MLSVRSQVSVRPLYGVEEFRKSRSMAGGMTGGLVLLALGRVSDDPLRQDPHAAESPFIHHADACDPPRADARGETRSAGRHAQAVEPGIGGDDPRAASGRRTAQASAGGAQNGSSRTREAETGQESSSGEKNAAGGPAAGEAVPPSAPVGQQTEIPPVSAGTGVSSVAAAPPAPVGGTQERPDDKSKALGAILDALNRHKRYPKQARRIGAEGTVQLLVTISADGKVSACSLGKGSGFGCSIQPPNGSARSLSALIYPRSVGGKVFRFWCRCATRSRMRDVPPVVLAGQERPMRGPLLTYGPPFRQSPYSETLG